MALLKFAVVLSVAGACACDFTRDPTILELTPAHPSVHALVVAGSPTVQVHLYTVDPSRDRNDQGTSLLTPISGARVLIQSGNETAELKEFATGDSVCIPPAHPPSTPPASTAGCYGVRLARPVVAGATYALTVTLPGGGTVTGTARAPSMPVVLAPVINAHVHAQAIPGSNGNGRYLDIPIRRVADPAVNAVNVQFVEMIAFRDGALLPDVTCGLGVDYPYGFIGDTATLHSVGITCLHLVDHAAEIVPWDSLHARLRFTVYDSAYSRYLETIRDEKIREDQASVGITGALGVFGGAATTDVPITVLPPSPN